MNPNKPRSKAKVGKKTTSSKVPRGNGEQNNNNRRSDRSPLSLQKGRMSSVPTAQTRVVKTGRPRMEIMRNGDCKIVHREYIGEIVAANATPSTFSVNSYPLNPGQASVFPWLSRIAQNFESYRFVKLRFDYETEAPSSLGGSLVLAVDYDAVDSSPSSKQQALAYRSSVRSAPWNPCSHVSVSEDLHKLTTNYVRAGPQPAATDLKTYDIGNLFVVTQGVTTALATCGELYVEYDVLLKTPVYDPILPNGSLVNATGTQVITTRLLGNTVTSDNVSSGLITMSVLNNVVTLTGLAVGSEIVCSYGALGAVMSGRVTMAATAGLTLKTTYAPTSAGDTALASIVSFTVTSSLATITLAIAGGTITTPSSAALFVETFSPVLLV